MKTTVICILTLTLLIGWTMAADKATQAHRIPQQAEAGAGHPATAEPQQQDGAQSLNLFQLGLAESPTIEYEIALGKFKFIFAGFTFSEVTDVRWNGNSIYHQLLDANSAILEHSEEGFSVEFQTDLPLDGPGIIDVALSSGETYDRAILAGPMPSLTWLAAATCKTATGVYNATQCGSVKSDVGTPPYPCCDNNANKKATDQEDGNCTWYAWYMAKKQRGWVVPSNWGGGGSWVANAGKTQGWKVISTPTVNTIACSSKLGHVAWVTAVSSDKKTITVLEMNCKVSPNCFGSGARTKQYTASSFQYITKN